MAGARAACIQTCHTQGQAPASPRPQKCPSVAPAAQILLFSSQFYGLFYTMLALYGGALSYVNEGSTYRPPEGCAGEPIDRI